MNKEEIKNLLSWYEKNRTNFKKQHASFSFIADEAMEQKDLFAIPVVSESLRDYMATRFAQTALQTWDSELSNEHREAMLEDWINRNGEGLTIQANIAKDAYSLADEMLKHR